MFFSSVQRKEYSETLNKHTDEFHVRVEVNKEPAWRQNKWLRRYTPYSWPWTLTPQHLFTCEMDGQEMKRLDDCVAKLKRLDTKGRLWPQEMIMEAQGGNLLLSDIESKVGSILHSLNRHSACPKVCGHLNNCYYQVFVGLPSLRGFVM